MKNCQHFGFLATALAALVVSTNAFGAESVTGSADWPEMTIEAGLDTNSRYIADGFAGSESFVLQPQATVGIGDLSFNVWSNFNLNEDGAAALDNKFNEVDLTLDYSFEFDAFSLVPRGVYYIFPNTEDESTFELGLEAAWNFWKGVSLFVDQKLDVVETRGLYLAKLGLRNEWQLTSWASLSSDISASLGSSKFHEAMTDDAVSKTTLTAFEASVGFDIQPVEHLSIQPHAEISTLLNSDLRDAVSAAEGDTFLFNAGVAATVSF